MRSISRFFIIWGPVIAWCAMLFCLSSIPNLRISPDNKTDEYLRSFAHGIFYMVLYVFSFRAINYQKNKQAFFSPWLLSSAYGFFDEFHQFFVPTRTFQLQDLAVDFSGAAFGGVVIWFMLQRVPRKLIPLVKSLGINC